MANMKLKLLLVSTIINYHRSLLIIVRHCQDEAEVGGGDHRVGEGMVRWVLDIFRNSFLLRNQNYLTFFFTFVQISLQGDEQRGSGTSHRRSSARIPGPLLTFLPHTEFREAP